MERSLTDFTPDELYRFKDRLRNRRVTGRSPDAVHFRKVYKPTMLGRIDAELRRRGLPVTRPDAPRAYGLRQVGRVT